MLMLSFIDMTLIVNGFHVKHCIYLAKVIFGQQSDYFLQKEDGYWKIALTCTSYLPFNRMH
jgi:hypothetical protein